MTATNAHMACTFDYTSMGCDFSITRLDGSTPLTEVITGSFDDMVEAEINGQDHHVEEWCTDPQRLHLGGLAAVTAIMHKYGVTHIIDPEGPNDREPMTIADYVLWMAMGDYKEE